MAHPPTEPDDFRSDDELARAHQRGDGPAFVELVRRHEQRLRAFVYGDPAWAAIGDALLESIWQAAGQAIREGRFRGGNFRGWLFKLTEAVASRHTNRAPTVRGRRLAQCFGRLHRANPRWHRLVMWVSHGLNRTAVARRHRLSKALLKQKYLRAMAAVRKCAEKKLGVASDQSNNGAAT